MLETLLGGLLGGAFRLAPEVLKFFDRDNERKHELAMQDKQFEFEKLRGQSKLAVQQEVNYGLGIDALSEALKGQAQPTGIRWVDALSASVRPVITYWWMLIYMVAKMIAVFIIWDMTGSIESVSNVLWTDADMALFAGILNFWFIGRIFERYGNK